MNLVPGLYIVQGERVGYCLIANKYECMKHTFELRMKDEMEERSTQ